MALFTLDRTNANKYSLGFVGLTGITEFVTIHHEEPINPRLEEIAGSRGFQAIKRLLGMRGDVLLIQITPMSISVVIDETADRTRMLQNVSEIIEEAYQFRLETTERSA